MDGPQKSPVRFVLITTTRNDAQGVQPMQITRFVGKRGAVCYDLRNDDDGFVARFETLEDAAQVARYIVGANMGDDERQHALKAMQRLEAGD